MKKAIVFGGGGLDGLYWLSNNPFLTEEDIMGSDLYGTSAGAIYATGIKVMGRENFDKFLTEIRISERRNIVGFYRELRKVVKDVDFPEGLYLFATDTLRWRPVALNAETQISLAKAVHASCAVPGLVAPAIHNKTILFDGGIPDGASNIANVPTDYDEVIVYAPFAQPEPKSSKLSWSAHADYAAIANRLHTHEGKLIHPSPDAWEKMFSFWRPRGILHLVDPCGVNDYEPSNYMIQDVTYPMEVKDPIWESLHVKAIGMAAKTVGNAYDAISAAIPVGQLK